MMSILHSKVSGKFAGRTRKVGAIIALIGLAAWLVVILLSPPRLPGGDLICFKDPGINLARGEGLVSRLDPSNSTLTPKLYSNYPPLFAILYAGFVRGFGVGVKPDEVFDFLGCAFASILFWFSVSSGGRGRASFILLAILLLILPIGPFWSQRERPDALAYSLVLLSMLALNRRDMRWSFLFAGLFAGLNCCLSPYGGMLSVASVGLLGFDRLRRTQYRCLFSPLFFIPGFVIPIAILLALAWRYDPEAPFRFLSVASGGSTHGQAGLGYFLSIFRGAPGEFFAAFSRFDSLRYKIMLGHLIFVMGLVAFFVLQNRRTFREASAQLVLFGIVGLGFVPMILFPYQPCYTSLTAATVLALLARFAYVNAWRVDRVSWITLIGVTFIALPAGLYFARETALLGKAAVSYQRMDSIIAAQADATASPALAATTPHCYFAFKTRRFEVVDLAYLNQPEQIRRVQYFAIPSLPVERARTEIERIGATVPLEVIHEPAAEYASPLLNQRFSYTWESWIMRAR